MLPFRPAFDRVRMSIAWKVGLLLLAATISTIFAIGAYYAYIQRNDSDSQCVLQALTERCKRVHRRIDNLAPLSDDDRRELRAFAAAADAAAQALDHGGTVDSHNVGPLSAEIATVFAAARAQWPATRARLIAFADADAASAPGARERLHAVFPRYQAEVQRVARAAERRRVALTDHMWNTLVLICAVHVIFLIGGMFAARGFIVRPLLLLKDAAVKVAAGEYSHSVPVVSNDEIGTMAGAFNHMSGQLAGTIQALRASETAVAGKARELEAANAELEQYAYAAAHDLQEPLRVVTTFSQLLRARYSEQLSAEAQVCLSYVEGGSGRMRALVGDLLSYSQAVHRAETPTSTDANAALQSAISACSVAIAESGAEIHIETLPHVLANDIELALVFQNLISNAIKYRGAAEPRIEVTAATEGDKCVVRVRDNGIGIDAAYHERIFDCSSVCTGRRCPGPASVWHWAKADREARRAYLRGVSKRGGRHVHVNSADRATRRQCSRGCRP
jgi:signal transduction histidine kinase